MSQQIVELANVHKKYLQGDAQINVLKGINLRVSQGETLSIVGPSGGGKSTLLSILSGVDRPSEGTVTVAGINLTQLSDEKITQFRAHAFGIIFQQFHLISHLNALENVMLPLEISQSASGSAHSSLSLAEIEDQARRLLGEVGLAERALHRPSQLSGGEAQRVAIARSLMTKPQLLLADEPSGNLDVKTGNQVMSLLFDLVAKHQSTLVLVTHSLELAAKCQRQLSLEEGQLKDI